MTAHIVPVNIYTYVAMSHTEAVTNHMDDTTALIEDKTAHIAPSHRAERMKKNTTQRIQKPNR